jgi:predicted transcriptional regulator
MQDFFEDQYAPTMVRLLRMLRDKKALTSRGTGLKTGDWIFNSGLSPRVAYEYRARLVERGWVDVLPDEERTTSQVVTCLSPKGEELLRALDSTRQLQEDAAREAARKRKDERKRA